MVETEQGIPMEPQAIAQLLVEYWKLLRATAKAIGALDEMMQRKLAAQAKYSERQLGVLSAQLNLKLIEFENEDFHPGMPASADNGDDYPDAEHLVVTKTLEPAVVCEMSVLRKGRVLIGPKPAIKE